MRLFLLGFTIFSLSAGCDIKLPAEDTGVSGTDADADADADAATD